MAEAGARPWGDGSWWAPPARRRLHLVGVGGVGMSAIAEALVALGHRVSGTDQRSSPVLDHLASVGVDVTSGHRPEAVAGLDALVRSTAVADSDPEVEAARSAGVAVLARAEALAGLCAQRRTVAVGGSHGKTTTTALTAAVLEAAGLDPGWLVGARLAGRPSGCRWGPGEWLVVEADESDGTFLRLRRDVAVVTGVEADHLDHWGDLPALLEGFVSFVEGASSVVLCADDAGAMSLTAALLSGRSMLTYGTAADADVRVRVVAHRDSGQELELSAAGERVSGLSLCMPGVHNARNAAGAVAAGMAAGLGLEEAATGVARFAGVHRRFELRGESGGVTFVDDYAHMPAEVASVVGAARGWRPGARLVCAFQPHRYTRTRDSGAGFAEAFDGVDLLVVTDVYPAGEDPIDGVSGRLVADAVRGVPEVIYLRSLAQAAEVLRDRLREGDLCLTVGAGDVTTLADLVGDL